MDILQQLVADIITKDIAMFNIFLVIGSLVLAYKVIGFPFNGTSGIPRFWAFFIMGALPWIFFIPLLTPIVDKNFAYGIPTIWLLLIWLFSLAHKFEEDKKEKDAENELARKNEAANIVKRLQEKK